MPTTALGLLIFVVLLAPGLTYSAYRKRRTPVDKPSTLRELGGIALPSVLCDVGAVAVFAVVHRVRPHDTPDVAALIAHPRPYSQQHYAELFWWGVGLLAVACVLALLAAALIGSDRWIRAVDRRPLSWLTPRGGVTVESAWWLLFNAEPGTRVYAGCVLDDGSYLGGWVLSFSPNSDETADRELVLAGEITYRGPDEGEATDLGVGAVSVSARRLQYLTVSYLPAPPLAEPQSGGRRRAATMLLRGARWPVLLALVVTTLLHTFWLARAGAVLGGVLIAAWLGRNPAIRSTDPAPTSPAGAAATSPRATSDPDARDSDTPELEASEPDSSVRSGEVPGTASEDTAADGRSDAG